MTAPRLAVGTIVDVHGARGVVAGFASNGIVLVSFAGCLPIAYDALYVWARPCSYNRQLAQGTGRHEVLS